MTEVQTSSNSNPNTYCQKFHLDQITKGTNTIICGRRLTGKSILSVDILQSRNNADVIIFSSTYVALSYGKYIDGKNIYSKYDPKILKKLLQRQHDRHIEDGSYDRELIIVFDDIAVNKDLWKDPHIRGMVRYGSSLGITSIFSIQFAGQLDDMFKRNIDYVFCFRDNMIVDQELLYKEFAGMFSTFKEFKSILDECIAEPYRCLVFDLKTPRKDPRQSVFWYKANLPKNIPPETIENNHALKCINVYKWLFPW